jgi:hypothetical protein
LGGKKIDIETGNDIEKGNDDKPINFILTFYHALPFTSAKRLNKEDVSIVLNASRAQTINLKMKRPCL